MNQDLLALGAALILVGAAALARVLNSYRQHRNWNKRRRDA